MLRGCRSFFFLLLSTAVLCSAFSWNPRRIQKAPDFSLPLLDGSTSLRLSSVTRDKPVLLIFWASWCPTCVEEIPVLNALARKYSEDKLQILAVNVQESRKVLTEFVKTNPLNYPVLLDQSGETAVKYKIAGLPVSVLLAKGGEILYYGFSLPGNLDELLASRRH